MDTKSVEALGYNYLPYERRRIGDEGSGFIREGEDLPSIL